MKLNTRNGGRVKKSKINWQFSVSIWQTLKVYDVLGNEVATLIDEFGNAGSYEVEFNVVSSIQHREFIFVGCKLVILLKLKK